MTPERWKQIEDLFQLALEQNPAERARFLDRACADDPSLRAEVESLIASSEQAETHIAAAVEEAARLFSGVHTQDESPGGLVGRRLGPYEVIRQIGRGGMGEVYLAARADAQYQKQVAIKVVRRGMDREAILRRFRHERQILASLDHPNIARLLDGGTTEDGLPYFVMEHIEGAPIDEYCDRQRLSTAERLRLFRTVCSAVHYAHQNLVVHRDLKPSNILVMADGTVKLLDFGIAKLLTPDVSSQTATTDQLMTPEYASPEQVRGEPITTSSDVYSLGVVLYELLTGRRPYRLRSTLPHDLLRAICEDEPEAPSLKRDSKPKTQDPRPKIRDSSPTAVASMLDRWRASLQYWTSKPKSWVLGLRSWVSSDLDNIVLMALRKEPQRRYASVEQFSEDIRRHLVGLPVMARKATLGYRAGKFVQRHKVGVVAAALILLTLIGGIVATTRQAQIARAERARAERRFNQVRQLANSFLFEFHPAIEDLPGSTPARELLVKRALEYLDSLASEASDDPSLARELATAYEKVGDVQGRPGFANLGDRAGALKSYQKALTIRQVLVAASPMSRENRRELSTTYERVGDTERILGRSVEALMHYRQAQRLREELLTADSTDIELRRELARGYQRIGDLLALTGEETEALALQQRALEVLQELAEKDPVDRTLRRDWFISLVKTGDRLAATGDRAAALGHYRHALSIAKAVSDEDPMNARSRRELAACYDKVGNMLAATGDQAGALSDYRQAFGIRQALFAADRKNAEVQRDLSISHDKIGSVLIELGETRAALDHYRLALSNDLALAAADPTNAQARQDVSISRVKLADALIKAGLAAEALDHYGEALKVREKLSAADPSNIEFRRDLIEAYTKLGQVHARMASETKASVAARIQQWQQARTWYQKSLDVLSDMRARGVLSESDADELENISREVARCDAALAKLGGK